MPTLDAMDHTVNDSITGYASGGGLFSALAALTPGPDWLDDFTASDLDLDFGLEYGTRPAGALIRHYDPDAEGMTAAEVTALATLLLQRHAVQWDHLYQLTVAVYDPIQNYNSTETLSFTDREHKKTGTVTDIREPGSTVERSVYGYNSATAVPSDKSVSSGKDRVTTTYNTADGEKGSETRTRSGNIGVTTTAQMIEGEIAVWRWEFIKTVMLDIANDIGLRIY